jgi:cytosine/adenosine deaminase-related metal-dependent hydrolase
VKQNIDLISIAADIDFPYLAKVLGMSGKIGTITPGAFADLLFLSANPLEDVTILNQPNTHLQAIIKDGRVVSSKIDGLRVEVPLV